MLRQLTSPLCSDVEVIDLIQSQSSDESVSMFDYGDNEDMHGFDERYE